MGHQRWGNADDDEVEEDAFGDPESDDEATERCPNCGASVYHDAEQCPRCSHYLSEEDSPRYTKPWWIVLGVVVCLYIVYRWIFF